MDVSGYENADIIFDLNNDITKEMVERYDIVFDGGVIEHIFDVGNGLRNICKMTKKDGLIFNINPVGNCLYNTFWNISPELFIEFYRANSYKIIECSLITFLTENREDRSWADRPVIWSPDVRLLSMGHPLQICEHVRSMYRLSDNPLPHTFFVAKKTNSERFEIPTPIGYREKHKSAKKRSG